MGKIELRIYELLGVRLFRVLVFKLERFIHRKDNGRNTNYHIATYDPIAIDGFIKYLFYNGAIHVRNVLFMMLVFFTRYFVCKNFSFLDVILWLFFFKDCYCVMLQRYNFLRIQIRNEHIKVKYQKKIARKGKQLILSPAEGLSSDERKNCIEFVKKFSKNITERNSVIIGEKDIQTLLSLRKMLLLEETKEREKE